MSQKNRNKDFWPTLFVSYGQIRIFIIGIHIRMKGIQISKKHIPFLRNRIPKINRIIQLQTNLYIYMDIKEFIGIYTGIYSDAT